MASMSNPSVDARLTISFGESMRYTTMGGGPENEPWKAGRAIQSAPPVPKLADFGPWNEKDVERALGGLDQDGLTLVPSVSRDIYDPKRHNRNPKKFRQDSFTTTILNFNFQQHDMNLYTNLIENGPIKDLCNEVLHKYVACGGTPQGLFTRVRGYFLARTMDPVAMIQKMSEQMQLSPGAMTDRDRVKEWIIGVWNQTMPHKKKYHDRAFLKTRRLDALAAAEGFNVNMVAGTGSPMFVTRTTKVLLGDQKTTSEVYVWDVVWKMMNTLVKVLDGPDPTRNLQRLAAEHPAWFLVRLKNKTEVYERAQLKNKTRPYYEYPAFLNVLWSFLEWNFENHKTTFLEDPESVNAVGFSWLDGGARKLVDWINGRYKHLYRDVVPPQGESQTVFDARVAAQEEFANRPGNLRGLIYSDDNCWVYTTVSGERLGCNPDYKQMDAGFEKNFFRLEFERMKRWWQGEIGDERLDNFWLQLLSMQHRFACQHLLLVWGSRVYMKESRLSTGVSGTTHFDGDRSALLLAILQRKVEETPLAERDSFVLEKLPAWLMKWTGAVIKPETWVWKRTTISQPIPLPFLGMKVVLATGGNRQEPLPTPPIEHLLRSCLNPKARMEPDRRMDRYRGLACVAWNYRSVLNSLRKSYEHFYNQNARPTGQQEEIWTCMEDIEFPQVSEPAKWFPSRVWVMNLFLSSDNKLLESEGIPDIVQEEITGWRHKQKMFITDDDSSEEPEESPEHYAWGDQMEETTYKAAARLRVQAETLDQLLLGEAIGASGEADISDPFQDSPPEEHVVRSQLEFPIAGIPEIRLGEPSVAGQSARNKGGPFKNKASTSRATTRNRTRWTDARAEQARKRSTKRFSRFASDRDQ
nr:MAG: RNA-dependent RNA polymerase [Wufeng shrew permutotetravirus 7]